MYSKQVWSQLKGIAVKKLINALIKDGWKRERNKGRQGKKGANTLAYYHPDGRKVVIHPHPQKTMGPKLLKKLLADIGWTEEDFIRLKLIA